MHKLMYPFNELHHEKMQFVKEITAMQIGCESGVREVLSVQFAHI